MPISLKLLALIRDIPNIVSEPMPLTALIGGKE